MQAETRDSSVRPGGHVVQFYDHESELSNTVAVAMAGAIDCGSTAVMIATEPHRRAFEAKLTAAGIDPPQAARDGTLIALDAAETLHEFMPAGRLDSEAFDRVIGGTIRSAGRTGRPVWAYGEMVALLWDAGDVVSAIDLERLWNDLLRERSFSLWCAYARSSVEDSDHAEALHRVCELHSAVIEPRRTDRPDEISRQFAPDQNSPRSAREFVAEVLREWGQPDELIEDARLVISELATNAVTHTRDQFSVTAARSGDSGVRLTVQDAASEKPTPRSSEVLTASGYGLNVVARLADSWGFDPDRHGKSVWAELRG
jgi:anti-sigma regulatory factor (Ser/Thr protein kinase)